MAETYELTKFKEIPADDYGFEPIEDDYGFEPINDPVGAINDEYGFESVDDYGFEPIEPEPVKKDAGWLKRMGEMYPTAGDRINAGANNLIRFFAQSFPLTRLYEPDVELSEPGRGFQPPGELAYLPKNPDYNEMQRKKKQLAKDLLDPEKYPTLMGMDEEQKSIFLDAMEDVQAIRSKKPTTETQKIALGQAKMIQETSKEYAKQVQGEQDMWIRIAKATGQLKSEEKKELEEILQDKKEKEIYELEGKPSGLTEDEFKMYIDNSDVILNAFGQPATESKFDRWKEGEPIIDNPGPVLRTITKNLNNVANAISSTARDMPSIFFQLVRHEALAYKEAQDPIKRFKEKGEVSGLFPMYMYAMKELFSSEQQLQSIADTMTESKVAWTAGVMDPSWGSPVIEGKADQFIYDATQGGMSLFESIAIYQLTGSANASALVFGLKAREDAFWEATYFRDVPISQADSWSNVRGVIESGLEYYGLEQMISRAVGPRGVRMLKASLIEGSQEWSQSISGNLIEKYGMEKKITLQEIWNQAMYEGAIGALMGVVATGAVKSVRDDVRYRKIYDFAKKNGIDEEDVTRILNVVDHKAKTFRGNINDLLKEQMTDLELQRARNKENGGKKQVMLKGYDAMGNPVYEEGDASWIDDMVKDATGVPDAQKDQALFDLMNKASGMEQKQEEREAEIAEIAKKTKAELLGEKEAEPEDTEPTGKYKEEALPKTEARILDSSFDGDEEKMGDYILGKDDEGKVGGKKLRVRINKVRSGQMTEDQAIIETKLDAGIILTEKEESTQDRMVDEELVTVPEEKTKKGETPKNLPIYDQKVSDIKRDVKKFQFKEGVNEKGVEPGKELGGQEYITVGTSAILMFEDLAGNEWLAHGHHRIDLAEKLGIKTVPAQKIREADGYTWEDARRMGVESNIRKGQGKISDFAEFFRGSDMTEAEAEKKGMINRAKGRAGFEIGRNASDDLYALYKAGKINETTALEIARNAKDQPGIQSAVIDQVLKRGLKHNEVTNFVRGLKANQGPKATETDMFGFDDTALNTARNRGKQADKVIGELKDRILSVQGALKRPKVAKKMGLQFSDEKSIRKEVEKLKAEIESWKNWHTDQNKISLLDQRISGKIKDVLAPYPAKAPALVFDKKIAVGDGGVFPTFDEMGNLTEDERNTLLDSIKDPSFDKNYTPADDKGDHPLDTVGMEIQKKASDWARDNLDHIFKIYDSMKETDYGRTVSTDTLRYLLTGSGFTRDFIGEHTPMFHEVASALAKIQTHRSIRKAMKKGQPVVYMGIGGSGAGKSSGMNNISPEEKAGMGVFMDYNHQQYWKLKQRVDMFRGYGFKVRFVFVARNPVSAWFGGVLMRGVKEVNPDYRVVPADQHLIMNEGSIQSAIQAWEDLVHVDPKNFDMVAVKNDYGYEQHRTLHTVEDLKNNVAYNYKEAKNVIIKYSFMAVEHGIFNETYMGEALHVWKELWPSGEIAERLGVYEGNRKEGLLRILKLAEKESAEKGIDLSIESVFSTPHPHTRIGEQYEMIKVEPRNLSQTYNELVKVGQTRGLSYPEAKRWANQVLKERAKIQEKKKVVPTGKQMEFSPGGVEAFGQGKAGEAQAEMDLLAFENEKKFAYKDDKHYEEAHQDLVNKLENIPEHFSQLTLDFSQKEETDSPLKQIKNNHFIDYRGQKINTVKDIAELATIFRHPNFEHLQVIFLKNKKVISHQVFTSGMRGFVTANKKKVRGKGKDYVQEQHKAMIEFFEDVKKVKERIGADAIYMAHNHPSGNHSPSQADISSTFNAKRIIGEAFKEHIVLNHQYYSRIHPRTGVSENKFKSPKQDYVKSLGLPEVSTVDGLANLAIMSNKKGRITVFLTTPDLRLIAVELVRADRNVGQFIYDMMHKHKADRYSLSMEEGTKFDYTNIPKGIDDIITLYEGEDGSIDYESQTQDGDIIPYPVFSSKSNAYVSQDTLDHKSILTRLQEDQKAYPAMTQEGILPDEANRLFNAYEEYKDAWFGGKDTAIFKAQNERARLQEELMKELGKNNYDQEAQDYDKAIHIFLDTQRNPGHIKRYYNGLTDEQKRIVDISQNLPIALQNIADKIRRSYERTGLDALEADVIRNVLDNYVARQWDLESDKGQELWRKFGTTTRHAKARVLETIIEGWANGFELKVGGATTNLEILKQEIYKTIADKKFIKALKGVKDLDGDPLLTHKPPAGKDYRMIDHPNFTYWQFAGYAKDGISYGRNFFITEEGQIFEKRQLYAPKGQADNLNNVLGKSKLMGVWGVKGLTKFNAITKAWILQTSLFHHMAFTRSYYLGTNHKKWSEMNIRQAYRQGLDAIRREDPMIMLGIKNGLTLGIKQDWNEDLIREKTWIGETIDKIFAKMGIVGKAGQYIKDKILTFRERQADFLFNKLGAGLKAKSFIIEMRNQMKLYPNEDIDQIAKRVSMLINDDFGGLHLGRLNRDPTLQHLFRLVALAPDWTESNIRTMVKTIRVSKTSGNRSAERRMYQKFWAGILTKGMLLNFIANFLLHAGDRDDDWFKEAWEQGRLKWMDVDITPIYNGTMKILGQEPSGDRKYFSLVGHFKDPIKFLFQAPPGETYSDPFYSLALSAKHKGSVISKMFADFTTGTDWAGRRFTTATELLGIDKEKGVYKTNVRGKHRKGDPKYGKLEGQTVTWDFGKGGAVKYTQIPSFILSQLKGLQPIQIQNMINWYLGEQEGFDALFNSLGLGVRTGYKSEEEGKKNVK